MSTTHFVNRSSALFVTAQFEPLSGMERAALELTRRLGSESPVRTIVFSGDVPATLNAVGVTAMHVPLGITRLLKATLRLRRELRELDVETPIVAVGLWAAVPTLLVAGRRRVIVWEHSLLQERLPHDRRVRLLHMFARLLYPRAATIVAVSGPVADCAATLAPRVRVVAIPNAFPEIGSGRNSTSRDPNAVACIGSLTPIKNVELAVRAMQHLPDDVELHVAGVGKQFDGLQSLAVRLGVGARVRMLGYVENVEDLLERVAVLAHPSHAETFGYSILEAARARAPVVVLNKPNMNRLVPRLAPGVVVERATPEAFAAGIAHALSREWGDGAFDDADRARAAEFEPRTVVAAWRSLLANSGGQA